jgi:anti-sigma regulatory factor (Ser/Thr protein kinase)
MDGGWPVTFADERTGRVLLLPALIHHLAAGIESPAQARALVAQALESLPGDTVAVAQLLTSEVVTNAVVHAGTALDLQIEIADFGARITVQDLSSAAPQRRVPNVGDVGGRGLALLDLLASAWGWQSTPTGKRVWFELVTLEPTNQEHPGGDLG